MLIPILFLYRGLTTLHASAQHSSGMPRPDRPVGLQVRPLETPVTGQSPVCTGALPQALVEGTTRRPGVERSSLLIVLHSQWYERAELGDSGQLCEFTLIGPPHPLTTFGDFGVFPAPMRAACAQVWRMPTSYCALRTQWRATAAWRGGSAAQVAACGPAKSRFLRF